MLMLPVYADVVKSVLLASWPGLTFNFRLGEGSDLHNDDEGSVSHTLQRPPGNFIMGLPAKCLPFVFFSNSFVVIVASPPPCWHCRCCCIS